MKNAMLVVLLASAPAAAHMKARVLAQGPGAAAWTSAFPMGVRIEPSLKPLAAAPSVLPSAPILGSPTPASPAAAQPAADSPLDVIRDASADAAQKSAALDRLFENPALALPAAEASPVPSNSAAASPVPEWFKSSGLSFALMKKSADGYLMAVLRHGRYELGVFLDKNGDAQAIFTKHALNPMGTPLKEEVALRTDASRRAVAGMLRVAHDEHPVSGNELAALQETLARLDGVRER